MASNMDDEDDEPTLELHEDGGELDQKSQLHSSIQQNDSFRSAGSSMSQSFSDPATRTVVIENVPVDFDKFLKGYLTDKDTGGGRLEQFQRDESNQNNVVATFAHTTGAAKVLEQKIIDIKPFNTQMTVRPLHSLQMTASSGSHEEILRKKTIKDEKPSDWKTETLSNLRPDQLICLQTFGILDDVSKCFTNVKVEEVSDGVRLSGVDLMDFKLKIYERLNETHSRFLDFSKVMASLITKERIKKLINDLLKRNGIKAFIKRLPERNSFNMYADSSDDMARADALLRDEFLEKELELKEEDKQTMQSQEWPDFVKDLCRDQDVELNVDNGKLVMACHKENAEKIMTKIKDFFAKHGVVEDSFGMTKLEAELISISHVLDDVKKMLNESAYGGELRYNPNTYGYMMRGSRIAVENARKHLQTMRENLVQERFEICQPGVNSLMESTRGKEFLEGLKKRQEVVIKTSPGFGAPVPADCLAMKYKLEIDPGREIVLKLGDILDMCANALIVPANPSLDLSRGFGLQVVYTGGEKIKEECRKYVTENGELLPGSVYVSSSGALLCGHVFHAVEPVCFDNTTIVIYERLIKALLFEASKRRLENVVFPFHFAALFARKKLFDAIKDFLQKNQTTVLKTIYFVGDDISLYRRFEKQLKNYESSMKPGSIELLTPEGISVRLFKGSICTLQVDVVVNSTAKSLSLANGGVSMAIDTAAGKNLQKECAAKAPKGLAEFGDILATKPHNLTCKAVYHGAAVQWDNVVGGASEKVLRSFVTKALTLAEKDGHTSIAFPAIGSGTLKIPHDVVAEAILDEILKFSRTNPVKTLKTIYTVAFEKNQESVAAFEKRYKQLQNLSTSQMQGGSHGLLCSYVEKLDVNVYCSRSLVRAVQDETMRFVESVSDSSCLEFTENLTEEQLHRVELLQYYNSVKISIDNGRVEFKGLKEDIAMAKRHFKYIVTDI